MLLLSSADYFSKLALSKHSFRERTVALSCKSMLKIELKYESSKLKTIIFSQTFAILDGVGFCFQAFAMLSSAFFINFLFKIFF